MPASMSRAELLALPASVDIRTAGRAFGLGERKVYDLVAHGNFPCRVLRVGRHYRVPTTGPDGLLAVLGVEPAADSGGTAA